jgi:hypothetical protein
LFLFLFILWITRNLVNPPRKMKPFTETVLNFNVRRSTMQVVPLQTYKNGLETLCPHFCYHAMALSARQLLFQQTRILNLLQLLRQFVSAYTPKEEDSKL